MKRGFVERNASLVPDSLLVLRRNKLIEQFDSFGVEAVIIYGDVADADELHYFVNLAPYWFSATSVIGKDGSQSIIAGMTARVNFWIAQMSGVDKSLVNGAGPAVNKELVKYLEGRYAQGSKIGMVGDYFPLEMQNAIEAAGFTTVWMTDAARAIVTTQDGGFKDTLEKGIELMNGALHKTLAEVKNGQTMQSIAADAEYACRSAGAMDVLILAGDKNFGLCKALDAPAAEPWTLFVLLQYLGQWLIIVRNSDPGLNNEAFDRRNACLQKLKPGKQPAVFHDGPWSFELCPMVRSDHAAYVASGELELSLNQIISLRASNKDKGIVIEDMVLISSDKAGLLTGI